MRTLTHAQPLDSRGFTLVEVMVAMVIGMIGIIVMMQMFSIFEGQKRTTTGGSDAQTAGAIALYEMERDIKQAGYGTAAFNLIGCNVTLPSGVTINSLAPVTINYTGNGANFGQDANTDTLMVVYGGTNGQTEGDSITAQSVTNSYAVATATSFRTNDIVIALPKTNIVTFPAIRPACNLSMTSVTGVNIPNVAVVTGYAGMIDGLLFNLGQPATIKMNVYAIRGGNLTVCDYMINNCGANNAADWLTIANNIVSLKAAYGVDTSNPIDGIVDGPSITLPVAPSTQCSLIRVAAAAVALVARNSQFNKEIVTNTAANTGKPINSPTWLANGINPILGNPSVLGPGTAADEPWKHYRYKVYETIAPLRNINWQGVKTGC